MNAQLVRRVIYPATQRLMGFGTSSCLDSLERSQYDPPEVIAERQLGQLRQLVLRAMQQVPHYADTYTQAGVRPEEIRNFEDFQALPLLDKGTVRQNPRRLIARNAGRLFQGRTGGTTGGIPMLCFSGVELAVTNKALVWRALRWWSIDVGDRLVDLWGHGASFAPGLRGKWVKWTRPIRNWLYNRRTLLVYEMSAERMETYWRILRRYRPRYLRGYASALYVFARFLREQRYDGRSLGLELVVSTSERLYEWQRTLLGDVFDCPVVNEYGAVELGIIAYECPEGSLHLSDEAMYVELLPIQGDSDLAEIVVTQLNNPDSPLIRYRLGDFATSITQGCRCGRSLRVLHGLGGRVRDLFLAPDGRYVSGVYFTHIMEHVPGVIKFQIVQETLHHLTVRIVPDGIDVVDEGLIKGRIQDVLGPEVMIQFEYAGDIPLDRPGKYRWIVSKLTGHMLTDTGPP